MLRNIGIRYHGSVCAPSSVAEEACLRTPQPALAACRLLLMGPFDRGCLAAWALLSAHVHAQVRTLRAAKASLRGRWTAFVGSIQGVAGSDAAPQVAAPSRRWHSMMPWGTATSVRTMGKLQSLGCASWCVCAVCDCGVIAGLGSSAACQPREPWCWVRGWVTVAMEHLHADLATV